MNKFIKAVVISSLILFLAGTLLALASLALGANPKVVGTRLNSMGLSNVYFWGHDRIYSHSYDYNYDYSYDYNYGYDSDSDGVEPPEQPQPPEPPIPGEYEITDLYFNFDAGDISITQGEDFALIYGSTQARNYFYESRDGSTWTIGSRDNRWKLFDFWRHNGDQLKLTVVLPADFVAGRVDIFMGAGNMRVASLKAGEIYVEAGLGNCQIGELLADSADLSVGLGNLDVRSFHAAESTLDVGMGVMKLGLAQPLAQYRCNLQVGLGNVVLGKNSYSGVADVSAGSEDSPYQMQVTCGMGSIEVRE